MADKDLQFITSVSEIRKKESFSMVNLELTVERGGSWAKHHVSLKDDKGESMEAQIGIWGKFGPVINEGAKIQATGCYFIGQHGDSVAINKVYKVDNNKAGKAEEEYNKFVESLGKE